MNRDEMWKVRDTAKQLNEFHHSYGPITTEVEFEKVTGIAAHLMKRLNIDQYSDYPKTAKTKNSLWDTKQ